METSATDLMSIILEVKPLYLTIVLGRYQNESQRESRLTRNSHLQTSSEKLSSYHSYSNTPTDRASRYVPHGQV